jgi:hypothetical protein
LPAANTRDDYNGTSDSTTKIYREIARPSRFTLSTNTHTTLAKEVVEHFLEPVQMKFQDRKEYAKPTHPIT